MGRGRGGEGKGALGKRFWEGVWKGRVSVEGEGNNRRAEGGQGGMENREGRDEGGGRSQRTSACNRKGYDRCITVGGKWTPI